jgi:hypothetical protein
MASVIDICNLALGNIREDSINSLDEQSKAAQVCKQRYELAVQYVLRDFPWNFASQTVALALHTEQPKEWLYAYVLPSKCLNARRIVPNINLAQDRTIYYHFDQNELDSLATPDKHKIPFEIGRTSTGVPAIFTNQPEAFLLYTVDEKDPNRYDSMFVELLAWYLSVMIAVPIVGAETGRKLRSDALQMYREISAQTKVASANERNNPPPPESPTITVRNW